MYRYDRAGNRTEMTAEEIAAWQATLPDAAALLARRRAVRIAEFRAEAGARIAALFSQPPDSLALAWKEINTLAMQVVLLRRQVNGTATQNEIDLLAASESLFTTQIQAIRDAESTASAAVTAAADAAAVDAVAPSWP